LGLVDGPHVSHANSLGIGSGPFSVAFWIKFNNDPIPNPSTGAPLFCQGDANSTAHLINYRNVGGKKT